MSDEREQVSFRVEAEVKRKLAVAAAEKSLKIKEYLLKGVGLLKLEEKEAGNK
jgi:hypothetical protein